MMRVVRAQLDAHVAAGRTIKATGRLRCSVARGSIQRPREAPWFGPGAITSLPSDTARDEARI